MGKRCFTRSLPTGTPCDLSRRIRPAREDVTVLDYIENVNPIVQAHPRITQTCLAAQIAIPLAFSEKGETSHKQACTLVELKTAELNDISVMLLAYELDLVTPSISIKVLQE